MAENDKPKTDYSSNSVRASQPQAESAPTPRIEQITTARLKKPSLGSRFREAFVGNDAQSVGSYIMFDILVPRFKELLFETITGGSGYALFGGNSPRANGRHQSQLISKTNYSGMSSGKPAVRDQRQVTNRERETHRFDEIIIDDRQEAVRALEALQMCIDQFDQATVADFYYAIGVSSNHTDLKFGWTDLSTGRVIPARGGGYIVDLPQTEVLP